MKTDELLRKIKTLLSADQRAQLAKRDSLETVLMKLSSKGEALREELDLDVDENRRQEIRRKLEVIEAQRAKGAKLLEEIDKLREAE